MIDFELNVHLIDLTSLEHTIISNIKEVLEKSRIVTKIKKHDKILNFAHFNTFDN